MTVDAQVKGCYASIKSAEAVLEILANKTMDNESKVMFEQTQQILTEVKSDLKMQLVRLEKKEPQYRN